MQYTIDSGIKFSNGSATSKVYVTVDPNIALRTLSAVVNAVSIQTGAFTALVAFQVDANKEQVRLWASASPLYKGDDPTNTEVLPIPLDPSKGVKIQPTNANPVNSGSNVAAFGPTDNIDGFPALQTATIDFESSQNGHFSQEVDVTVSYNQNDAEKPMGQYSGKVKLYAMLMP